MSTKPKRIKSIMAKIFIKMHDVCCLAVLKSFFFLYFRFESQRTYLSSPWCLTNLLGLQGVQWIWELVVVRVSWPGHLGYKKKNQLFFLIHIMDHDRSDLKCTREAWHVFEPLNNLPLIKLPVLFFSIWSLKLRWVGKSPVTELLMYGLTRLSIIQLLW